MITRRRAGLLGAWAMTAAILLGACSSGSEAGDTGDNPEGTSETSTEKGSETGAQTPEPEETEPEEAPSEAPLEVKLLQVTLADGSAEPNAELLEVTQGTPIRITVTADQADELHVHGYDVSVEVGPDEPATLDFIADETGRFEIEFHETGHQVFLLQVEP